MPDDRRPPLPASVSRDDLAELIDDLLVNVREDCPEEFRSLRLQRALERGDEMLRELRRQPKPRDQAPAPIVFGQPREGMNSAQRMAEAARRAARGKHGHGKRNGHAHHGTQSRSGRP